jgi:hypothetical protein
MHQVNLYEVSIAIGMPTLDGLIQACIWNIKMAALRTNMVHK